MLLVHKKSGGILSELYQGNIEIRGKRTTVYDRDLSCEKLGLDPDEWWEVNPNSGLAIRLKMYYPCFDPVLDKNGKLKAIDAWKKDEIEDKLREKAAQIAAEAAAEEAAKWFPDDNEEEL